MKIRALFSVLTLMCLSACSYQKPQMIIIDSNVSAMVYQGDKRIGETPFAAKIPRSEIGNLSLRRSGYKTVELPVRKVYSRSTPFISSLYSDVTSEDQNKDDIVAAITLLPSLPLFMLTDATVFLNGSWIEYIPNSFYVEMVPVGRKTASADFLRQLQIKNYALKLYPDMVSGNREVLSAFSKLSDHSEQKVSKLLAENKDPVSFAEAAAF